LPRLQRQGQRFLKRQFLGAAAVAIGQQAERAAPAGAAFAEQSDPQQERRGGGGGIDRELAIALLREDQFKATRSPERRKGGSGEAGSISSNGSRGRAASSKLRT
jgi:hypothetical protein